MGKIAPEMYPKTYKKAEEFIKKVNNYLKENNAVHFQCIIEDFKSEGNQLIGELNVLKEGLLEGSRKGGRNNCDDRINEINKIIKEIQELWNSLK